MAESSVLSARSRSVGTACSSWAAGFLRVKDRHLGETLMTVHTCRLLLPPCRHSAPQSYVELPPRGQDSPWWLGLPVFVNIMLNKKLLPRTLHCKLYYLHLRIQENTINRYRRICLNILKASGITRPE